MTALRDSAAVSGSLRRATTPPTAGTTDLVGVGSRFISPSPPPTPRIRVDQHEDCELELSPHATKIATAVNVNSRLEYSDPFSGAQHNAAGANSQSLHVKRSRGDRGSQRSRSDSLFPYPNSENTSGPSNESYSSCGSNDSEFEHDRVVIPLTRRGSFVSDTKSPHRGNTAAESQSRHSLVDNDGLESDSTPMYSQSSGDDSDSDSSRPYTSSRMLAVILPRISRETSVKSDGGEQDHLELRQSLEAIPHSSHSISHSPVIVKSQRYALQKQIYSHMVTARSDDASLPTQQFFPKDRLCTVITHDTVSAELFSRLRKTHTEEQIHGYTNAICNITQCYVGGRMRRRSYRSIFVILVLADKSDLIPSFLEEQVSDLDLPLVPVKDSGFTSGFRRRSSDPSRTPQPLLTCFDDEEWSPSHRDQFDRYQWYMLAPFFSKGKHGQINHYPLHDLQILPYETWQQTEDVAATREGGYGRVIMVRMHPAHHKLAERTGANRGFAVKQLLASDRRSFRKEREMLKKFSGANSHRHIVSLLATYRHRSKYHFVFDRAESDLGQFWESSERSPRINHDDVLWISQQCLGIAAGLFRIHQHKTLKVRRVSKGLEQNQTLEPTQVKFAADTVTGTSDNHPELDACAAEHRLVDPHRTFSSEVGSLEHYEIRYGRHGDINPQNILWFSDDLADSMVSTNNLRGVLKIADFGTAEMNSAYSKSGPRDVANTMTYRPPECDAADKTIRQTFDIWCLGCVFLEFATWMLGGNALVKQFAQKRMSRDPAYGNDETDTYFELIWNKETRKTEARVKPSVLEFVEDLHRKRRCTEFLHHFLILVMNDMLVVDSQQRLSCRDVRKRLKQLHADCHTEAYSISPSQWRNGTHVTPNNFSRRSEIKLSKEAQRQIARNLPLIQV